MAMARRTHRNKYAAQAAAAREARRREAMCGSKRAFASEAAAWQRGQRVYRCPYCGHWHRSGA